MENKFNKNYPQFNQKRNIKVELLSMKHLNPQAPVLMTLAAKKVKPVVGNQLVKLCLLQGVWAQKTVTAAV